MENQNNNIQNMTDLDQTAPKIAKSMDSRKSSLQQVAKITMIIFVVTLSLLALFGVIDIWHPSSILGVYTKFEGTLGILAFSSFTLNLGLRIYMGIKKFD